MACFVEQLLDLSRSTLTRSTLLLQIALRSRLAEVVKVAGRGACGRDRGDRSRAGRGGRRPVDPRAHRHQPRHERTPVRACAGARPPPRSSTAASDLSVEDSGPGRRAGDRADVVRALHRAAACSRDRVAGTGLGLAIARAYALAHRGDLRYEPGQPPARGSWSSCLPSRSSPLVDWVTDGRPRAR